MTVGFKQVDAAYVPVAVAKPCDTDVKSDCSKAIYEMRIVSGSSDTQGTRRSGPSTEEAKKAIQDYENALKNVAAAKSRVNSIGEEIKTISTRKAELDAKIEKYNKEKTLAEKAKEDKFSLEAKKAAGTSTEDDLRRLASIDALIRNVDAIAPTSTEQQERSDAEAKINAARDRLKTASQEQTGLEGEAEKLKPQAKEAEQHLDKLQRADAFSVYGRFEGSGGAEGTKASVGLGKVFSTGVASQNISAGLGKYYENIGMAACYDAVAKLSGVIKDGNELNKLLADCRSSTIETAGAQTAEQKK